MVRPTHIDVRSVRLPAGRILAKELKYKKIVTIADDFAYGHEMCAGFQRAFEDNGGKNHLRRFSRLATRTTEATSRR